MEVEARAGQSVFLRGWGEYQRYSLKLTESRRVRARRTWRCAPWSPEALERRVAAIEAAGLGIGWIDGDHGHGPAYRFTDPDGHVMELLLRDREVRAAGAPAPVAAATSRSATRPRRGGQAARPRQRARARRRRLPALRQDVLGYRLLRADRARRRHRDRRLDEPHDRRARADLRRGRAPAPAGASTTSRSGSTRARSACAPPTSSSTTASRSRRRRRSTRSRRASSSTASSPAATASRSRPAATSSTTPTPSRRVWSEAERARGQAWGVKTVESFHTYGTPPDARRPRLRAGRGRRRALAGAALGELRRARARGVGGLVVGLLLRAALGGDALAVELDLARRSRPRPSRAPRAISRAAGSAALQAAVEGLDRDPRAAGEHVVEVQRALVRARRSRTSTRR